LSTDLKKLAFEVQVDPANLSATDGPARYRTTRWSPVLIAVARTLKPPLRERSAVTLRQELGRTVSDPPNVEQEMEALRGARIIVEGRP
jgi:hypothetical protein